jgi:hypothetical protein
VAITKEEKGREILATWVPTSLADQVKQASEGERRSVSSFVRHLLEDSFASSSPAKADRAPASGQRFTDSRSGAGP